MLPRTLADRIALSVFTLGGIFLLWYEIFHIMPTYYAEQTSTTYIHLFFAIFFAANIYGNMFMLATTDTTGSDVVFPSRHAPAGWRYCEKCDANVPPRSHHCKICDVCVLKRDHHCWFAGYCIGHDNQRYYIVMVVYMVLAGIYCNVFNADFVANVKFPNGVGVFSVLSFIAPHASFIFRFEDIYTSFVTSLTTIGVLLTCMFVWLLHAQLSQLRHGQTQFEKKKGIYTYDVGLYDNVVDVLGKKWYLVWLFPFIPSRLPGDGITFRTRETKSM